MKCKYLYYEKRFIEGVKGKQKFSRCRRYKKGVTKLWDCLGIPVIGIPCNIDKYCKYRKEKEK